MLSRANSLSGRADGQVFVSGVPRGSGAPLAHAWCESVGRSGRKISAGVLHWYVALSKVIRWEVGEAGAFDRSLTPDEIWIGSTTLVDGHVVISDTSGDLISLNSVQTVGQLTVTTSTFSSHCRHVLDQERPAGSLHGLLHTVGRNLARKGKKLAYRSKFNAAISPI